MQNIHRTFGNNPNKYPPSIQALIKRILKGGSLPRINPLVDSYNVISLKYRVCVGAEDLEHCAGNVFLAPADGSEHFVPLGETVEDPPKSGEWVYKDDTGVICRKLNWREGDRTKITPETKHAVVVIEAIPPFSRENLEHALAEQVELIHTYCSSEVTTHVLDLDHTNCEL